MHTQHRLHTAKLRNTKKVAFVVLYIPLCLIYHSSFDLSLSSVNTCFVHLTLLLLMSPLLFELQRKACECELKMTKRIKKLKKKKNSVSIQIYLWSGNGIFAQAIREKKDLFQQYLSRKCDLGTVVHLNNTVSAVLMGTISLEEIRSCENCYLSSCYL